MLNIRLIKLFINYYYKAFIFYTTIIKRKITNIVTTKAKILQSRQVTFDKLLKFKYYHLQRL